MEKYASELKIIIASSIGIFGAWLALSMASVIETYCPPSSHWILKMVIPTLFIILPFLIIQWYLDVFD